MDEPITYPTWSDVGVPSVMVDAIRRLGNGEILDYLILNRVFRFQIKAQYVYTCQKCHHQKRLSRNYESYLVCEQCKSEKISSTANWRMGKDRIQSYSDSGSDTSVRKLVQQMSTVYGQYFRDYPPEDFVKCDWVLKREAMSLPHHESAWAQYANNSNPEFASDMPCFSSQFCCGEKVVANTERLAICKAAVLCPFLWDDCFDWKYLAPRDEGRETHILPLLNIWSKLRGGDSERLSLSPPMSYRQMASYAAISNAAVPAPVAAADHDHGPDNEVPAAIVEVLAQEPGLLESMFGDNNG